MTDNSDLSDVDDVVGEKANKKEPKTSLISTAKKEKKEKKSKEKETRYAHLGDESSGDDEADGKSPLKMKKSKPFMFGSAKKDKDKKKEVEAAKNNPEINPNAGLAPGPSAQDSAKDDNTKEKKDKDKKKDKKPHQLNKLKLVKKSKHSEKEAEAEAKIKSEEIAIFGVPLELAAERQKCHDGIPLPLVVRLCVDHIEEHGLMLEGIYRSSGVKSKVNKLKAALSSRTCNNVNLGDFEPAVVASVLKQYLRELPEPVLTQNLMPKFETVSAASEPQKRIEGMKQLIASLPESNRALLNWIFVHMSHVIERERFNKMTFQNVSIVLSPTMKISHRVLNCFFENSHILFDGIQLKKYVPPISGEGASAQVEALDTEKMIDEEIKKQESLLADLHLQISSGAASKKTEEQIWEQQRIVTQLKRKMRQVKKLSEGQQGEGNELKPKYEPIDYDEELDFSLRVPSRGTIASHDQEPSQEQQQEHVEMRPSSPVAVMLDHEKDTPDDDDNNEDVEQKVTVMVHRTQEQKSSQDLPTPPQQLPAPAASEVKDKETTVPDSAAPPPPATSKSNVTVVRLNSAEKPQPPEQQQQQQELSMPLLPPPPASKKTGSRVHHAAILQPVPASPQKPIPVTKPPEVKETQADQQAQQDQDQKQVAADPNLLGGEMPTKAVKSKSLPRGFPSDGSAFSSFGGAHQQNANAKVTSPINESDEINVDELQMEALRLKLEYDELMAVKSELEQRKQSERKEMEELREEIATMQTLYQYRTYSVDSSESSSDEGEKVHKNQDEIDELSKILADLIRENRELEEKRLSLCQKIQDERSSCINLRVAIRLEQEKILRRKNRRQDQ